MGLVCCVSKEIKLQYSHIRGVPGESMGRAGHGEIVAARVYRLCCCLAVGYELSSECCLEGILRERAKLYIACVSGD